MVKHVLLLLCLVGVAACASRVFTKQDAIHVAEAEVRRHGRVIDKGMHTVVVPSLAQFELRPSYTIWIVRFQSGPSEQSAVYVVHVNPATGKAEDFTDMRDTIPAG